MPRTPEQQARDFLEGTTLNARKAEAERRFAVALANHDREARVGNREGIEQYRMEATALLESVLDAVNEIYRFVERTQN